MNDMSKFLPSFLNGFSEAEDKTAYDETVSTILKSGNGLQDLLFHLRNRRPNQIDLAQETVKKAVLIGDRNAANEAVLFALSHDGQNSEELLSQVFRPAIDFLIAQNDVRWTYFGWILAQKSGFFSRLSDDDAKRLLKNLESVPRIEHQIEAVLSRIAKHHPGLVWDYFGERLRQEKTLSGDLERRFQAIPFSLYELQNQLQKNAQLAISKVRAWFQEDDYLFRFRGGRLLSNVFPKFEEGIANAFEELVESGSGVDTDFILSVMENYHGEAITHETLKRIVQKFPDDKIKLSKVRISLDNTGVVWGEFGFRDALRAKKAQLDGWLSDERPAVAKFAMSHAAELDLEIAAEQKRADEMKALRDLEFEGRVDAKTTSDGGNNG